MHVPFSRRRRDRTLVTDRANQRAYKPPQPMAAYRLFNANIQRV